MHRGRLAALSMRLRLNRASESEAAWLARTVDRESRRRGAAVELRPDGRLHLLRDDSTLAAHASR